jgi:hypothetical protein
MRGVHVDAARGHGRLVFHRGEAMRTATAAPAHIRPRPKALSAQSAAARPDDAACIAPPQRRCSVWLVLSIRGGVASTHLSALLSNDFAVPGTDSARAATILERRFGDRSDGEYLLVFTTRRRLTSSSRAQLQATVDRAVSTIASARAGPIAVERTGRSSPPRRSSWSRHFPASSTGESQACKSSGSASRSRSSRRNDRVCAARAVADGRARPVELAAAHTLARLARVEPSPLTRRQERSC